jgi:hypothetical protein
MKKNETMKKIILLLIISFSSFLSIFGTNGFGHSVSIQGEFNVVPCKSYQYIVLPPPPVNYFEKGEWSVQNGHFSDAYGGGTRIRTSETSVDVIWDAGAASGGLSYYFETASGGDYYQGVLAVRIEYATISGFGEIKEDDIATYTANYSNSNNYSINWISVNGKLSIISGQGTKIVKIRADKGIGTDQLKVSFGECLSELKTVKINSATTIISDQTITTNKDFSNRFIKISNTTIKNNAMVNITAEESIVISPSFLAQTGANITIKVTGPGSTLRSSSIEEKKEEDEIEEISEIPLTQYISTLIDEVDAYSQISSVKLYSLTGSVIYFSTSDFDIQTKNIASGIYILEKKYNNGNMNREKVILKR